MCEEGSIMLMLVESAVLSVATFAVSIALFYIAAEFEAYEKTEENIG